MKQYETKNNEKGDVFFRSGLYIDVITQPQLMSLYVYKSMIYATVPLAKKVHLQIITQQSRQTIAS